MSLGLRRVARVIHRVWITTGIVLLVVFTAWSLYAVRPRAEARAALQSDSRATVEESESHWIFRPTAAELSRGVVFFPGALVNPIAYAPIARRLAEAGHPVVLVRVPRRGAFGGAEGPAPFARARDGMRRVPAPGWIVAGHSRGAEIASRMLVHDPAGIEGLVLMGSSHPRDVSLAHLTIPVTRVYGTRDTVADVEKQEATRHNLPRDAKWVRIDGGNHSQFGYYGFQPGDWPATITRAEQQRIIFGALLETLRAAGKEGST